VAKFLSVPDGLPTGPSGTHPSAVFAVLRKAEKWMLERLR
jgi:hypothetical protein